MSSAASALAGNYMHRCTLRGHAIIHVTLTAGPNAVYTALFCDRSVGCSIRYSYRD
jgi:hypothetical protein